MTSDAEKIGMGGDTPQRTAKRGMGRSETIENALGEVPRRECAS